MKTLTARMKFLIIILMLTSCNKNNATHDQKGKRGIGFHTSPYHWIDARIFHDKNHAYDKRLYRIENVHFDEMIAKKDKLFSPNKAYWSYLKNTAHGKQNNKSFVYIHTEGEKKLLINFGSLYTNFHYLRKNWINEKLLFIRVIRGRVTGIDLIVDVELEKIIYYEPYYDGVTAYSQYQEAKILQLKSDIAVFDDKGIPLPRVNITPISLSINYSPVITNVYGGVNLGTNIQSVKWVTASKEGYQTSKQIEFKANKRPLKIVLIKIK